ncbi:uncharacterized protein Dana_GF26614 [Drosophila ananassae]|uniref:Protein midgut expression 1 n=1 Tax=Drosophila ananassae TaxID=7217 RepID=A0A0P8ZF63_DROAN|nr:uncharacterized protein Dana_GF26614 [Drosophila ananassae]
MCRALCCCCQKGLSCIFTILCSTLGILIVLAFIIYFCFFHKSSVQSKQMDSEPPATTEMDATVTAVTAARALLGTSREPSRLRAFLHKLIDTF